MSDTLETWIHRELEKRNWSVRELGRHIGISPSHTARIVNGEVTPSVKVCKKIAQVFDVSAELVFRLAGILPPLAPSLAEERQLSHILHTMSPEERQDVLRYARFRQGNGSDAQGSAAWPHEVDERPPASYPPPGTIGGDPRTLSVQPLLESLAMRAIAEIGEEGEQALVDVLMEIVKHKKALGERERRDVDEEEICDAEGNSDRQEGERNSEGAQGS